MAVLGVTGGDTRTERRVLVTGGAGFVGSNYVRHALERGHVVVVLDNLETGDLANLDLVKGHPRLYVAVGDAADGATVGRILRSLAVDTVVHFAAQSSVSVSLSQAAMGWESPTFRANRHATERLLACARAYRDEGGSLRNFHYVSTDEVFGDAALVGEFHERLPYAPSTPYAYSKMLGDEAVKRAFLDDALPTTISYSANNYGPNAPPVTLVPRAAHLALRGDAIQIFGTGEHEREFLHVDDHCRAIELILDRGTAGEAYCVAGSARRRVAAVVRDVCAHLDRLVPLGGGRSYLDRVMHCAPRPHDDLSYRTDDAKLAALGLYRHVDFDEGLRETIAWVVRHRERTSTTSYAARVLERPRWSVGAAKHWRAALGIGAFRRVVVVGGGLAGSAVTVQIVRHYSRRSSDGAAPLPLRIELIDSAGRHGRGVAYDTDDASHRMLTPVGLASLLAEEPDHLLVWLREHRSLWDAAGEYADAPIERTMFLPRGVYGTYVAHVLAEAVHEAERCGQIFVTQRRDAVVRVAREGATTVVSLVGGERLTADSVVIAVGRGKPAALESLEKYPHFIASPYDAGALDGPCRDIDAEVLIVGTGPAMVDAVLRLHAGGHRGQVTALSRRGLLDLPFEPARPYEPAHFTAPNLLSTDDPLTPARILRLFRREVARARPLGAKQVMLALPRAPMQQAWERLGPAAKRSYLRHLRVFFNHLARVHHGDSHAILDGMRRSGRLRVVAGRLDVASAVPVGPRLHITFRERRTGRTESLTPRYVIGCTGPGFELRSALQPLLQQMLADGVVVADAAGIGLDVDGACRAAGAIYAIGAPVQGVYLFADFIRTIAAHAACIARDVVDRLTVEGRNHRRVDRPENPPPRASRTVAL